MFLVSVITSKLTKVYSAMLALLLFAASTVGINIHVRGVTDKITQLYSYSFYPSTQKVQEYGVIEKNRTYKMHMAKNESEFCQIAVRSTVSEDMDISLSDFTDKNGNKVKTELLREYNVQTTAGILGRYPDPIVPCDGNAMTITPVIKERNYVFVIMATTDENTVPGEYKAEVSAVVSSGKDADIKSFKAEVTLEVWDFTLSDVPTMTTAVGLERSAIARFHGVTVGSEKCSELYKKYYDFMLDHGITVYDMPYDILDPRADEYMSDPRVTSFRIPYNKSDDEIIRAYYEKLSSNETWLNKSYFYPIDEPVTAADVEKYNGICNRLSELFPGYNMVTPFYVNYLEEVGEENIAIQQGKSNIICANTPLFVEKGFTQKAADRVNNGDRLWWYVCCGPSPSTKMCNLFVQQSTLMHRVLFWQQKQYNVEGLLYWDSNYWGDTLDQSGQPASPWESAWSTPWTGPDTFGDGVLMYDGARVGIDGPVSSLRLEAMRDGIEDHAYLTLAQQVLGEKETNKIISKVTKDLEHYTMSQKTFDSVRNELGKALEKAIK